MCTQDKLEALVKASQAFQEQPAEMETLWDSCSCLLYSLEDRQKQLGLGDKVGSCIHSSRVHPSYMTKNYVVR